jgi:hypothetical protein
MAPTVAPAFLAPLSLEAPPPRLRTVRYPIIVEQALKAAVQTQPLPETKISMADQWQRRLFSALCRRYGLEPYRCKGQRYTTVMVRAPRVFFNNTLWPEYLELQAALHSYLNEATERIIREEVYRDAAEAKERAG